MSDNELNELHEVAISIGLLSLLFVLFGSIGAAMLYVAVRDGAVKIEMEKPK